MIVITGASDGLGKALADVFRASGKRVVNLSRSENPHTENIPCDLTNDASIEQAAQATLAISEPLELLVNCAGVISLENLNEVKSTEVKRVFQVNIMGPMVLTSRLADRLKIDNGDVVNIASTVGTKAYEKQAAYGASKWAMRGFSQNLQLEFKDTGVRVLSVCVGGFVSGLTAKVGQPVADPENWMKPEDVAQCVKQLVELPKNMEVSEIVINRK
ncbi:MAG: SDR family oxidoreductase [Candidatus Saccharimonadales bacterium]